MTRKAEKAPGELRRLARYWGGLPFRHPVSAALVLVWLVPVAWLLAWMANRR